MPEMRHTDEVASATELPARPDWQHRVVVVVISLVAAVLLWLLAAAFLPRWWSHRVGSVVNDSISTGIIFGVFCGTLFTLLPLLVLRLAIRRRRRPRSRLLLLGAAILLAVPNLLTLWIVLGRSKAAHAGERTLDVEGTGFRGATAAGAIGGAAVFVALAWVMRSRRRLRDRESQLRDERADLQSRLDKYTSGDTPAG
jgi:membrane associated rhomboid family serine protease